MSNGKGKIRLTALTCSIIKSKKDPKKHIICIPVEDNNLYFSEEKGNVYLDFMYNEIKTKRDDSKDTHIINQSVPKEVRDALAAQTLKAYPPTLGNMQHWDGSAGAYSEPPANSVPVADDASTDDLPF